MTASFQVKNPNFEQTVRDSFAKQGFMQHLNATLTEVSPGQMTITVPFSPNFTQQHGFFHAGVATSIVDVACGYAAYSLMPPNSEVLTIEFKTNFVAPAIGAQLIAIGKVLKPGSTVTVCQGDVFCVNEGRQKLCATMLTSMICKPAV